MRRIKFPGDLWSGSNVFVWILSNIFANCILVSLKDCFCFKDSEAKVISEKLLKHSRNARRHLRWKRNNNIRENYSSLSLLIQFEVWILREKSIKDLKICCWLKTYISFQFYSITSLKHLEERERWKEEEKIGRVYTIGNERPIIDGWIKREIDVEALNTLNLMMSLSIERSTTKRVRRRIGIY